MVALLRDNHLCATRKWRTTKVCSTKFPAAQVLRVGVDGSFVTSRPGPFYMLPDIGAAGWLTNAVPLETVSSQFEHSSARTIENQSALGQAASGSTRAHAYQCFEVRRAASTNTATIGETIPKRRRDSYSSPTRINDECPRRHLRQLQLSKHSGTPVDHW